MRIFLLITTIVLWGIIGSAATRRVPPDRSGKSTKKSVQGSATPESQDLSDFNPHVESAVVPPRGQADEDVDELESDSDEPSGSQHVHFEEPPQTPTKEGTSGDGGNEGGQDRTPEPPKVPSTPDSLGRYLLGHQRSASDTDLYHRPSHVRERLAQAQDDEIHRKWHRWYMFNNDDRRKRYSEMRGRFIGTSHDMSASTGATMLSFLGRPEKDPAHPERLGEMIVSRDIRRNKKLYKIALELFEEFKRRIAAIRRQEYEEECRQAMEAREAYAAAVQQYESELAARKQAAQKEPAKVAKPAQRGRPKRKRGTAKGKEKADGESEGVSSSTRSDEDAPDLDATPRRPPPNLRSRRTRAQGQVVQSDAEQDESDPPQLPEPQLLFAQNNGTFGIEDMALSDEDFAMQLGEAAHQNRRENEAHELRRSKGGSSSGQNGSSSSSAHEQEVGDEQDSYSSRASISASGRRGPEADASDSLAFFRRNRHGPSTSTPRAAGGASTSAGFLHPGARPAAALNGSDVFVGPSGLVAEVVLPLRQRPPNPASAAAHGPPARPQQRARMQQQAGNAQGSGSRSRPPTDAGSASGSSRGHQSAQGLHAPIGSRNMAPPPSLRSAVAPASIRGHSPPASARVHSPPASAQAFAPANRHRAAPASSRARSPSTSAQGHSLPPELRSPPASIPPTLDAGVTSDPGTNEHNAPASELPARIRNWLVVHHVDRSLWVEVEMAYFTGLAEPPAARRAAWTVELEQLQAELLIDAVDLRELVLAMLRSAVGL